MKEPEGSPEWLLAFEALQCDHGPYAIPEEKAVAALAEKLPQGMQRRWALLKQKRRAEGMPAPLGRQIVFFILSGFKLDESTGAPAALISLLSLRDACKKDILSMSTLSSFIDTWNRIMLLASASQVSAKDKLIYLKDIVELATDEEIKTEYRFFEESPEQDQDIDELMVRLVKVRDRVLGKKARKQTEHAIAHAVAGAHRRGQAGQADEDGP